MSAIASEAELSEFLRTRRSIREFRPVNVPRRLLDQVIETATWAPSAHNRQPWRFVVLLDLEKRTRLVDAMGEKFRRDLRSDGIEEQPIERQIARSRNMLLGAPVVIILCQDTSACDVYPDPNRQQAELTMGLQSVALAGGQLLLAAHAAGLGGVWVCAPLFAAEIVRAVFDLPAAWEPQAFILLGYPAYQPEARPRQTLTEVVRYV